MGKDCIMDFVSSWKAVLVPVLLTFPEEAQTSAHSPRTDQSMSPPKSILPNWWVYQVEGLLTSVWWPQSSCHLWQVSPQHRGRLPCPHSCRVSSPVNPPAPPETAKPSATRAEVHRAGRGVRGVAGILGGTLLVSPTPSSSEGISASLILRVSWGSQSQGL